MERKSFLFNLKLRFIYKLLFEKTSFWAVLNWTCHWIPTCDIYNALTVVNLFLLRYFMYLEIVSSGMNPLPSNQKPKYLPLRRTIIIVWGRIIIGYNRSFLSVNLWLLKKRWSSFNGHYTECTNVTVQSDYYSENMRLTSTFAFTIYYG